MKRTNRWYLLVILVCGFSLLFLQGQSKYCLDIDKDGYFLPTCGSQCDPLDCDDTNPAVNPGATEGPEGDPTCSDGIDNDCDGYVDDTDAGCRAPVSYLPDTGADICYDMDSVIECPAPGEPFYGQDAQYVTNPMSFTDHGDGTVTDNVTGLMWQQEDDDVKRDWYEAVDYCEALELADHTDWRLPDIKELRSLVDNTRYDPAIDTTYFPGTASSYYWSSSTYAEIPYIACFVTFYSGSVDVSFKSNHKYVRCVR